MPDAQQQQQVKSLVKAFVKEMVKGKTVNVLAPSGDLRTCCATLSRHLDVLTIAVGSKSRKIVLSEVDEIHAGMGAEGVATPLDALCATMLLQSGEAISFRFVDVEARDAWIFCLNMFADRQRQVGP